MAEQTVPWWRKALNYALGGIRSGFGFFPRPAKPEAAPEPEPIVSREEPQEEETVLTCPPANPQAIATQPATLAEPAAIAEPEMVAIAVPETAVQVAPAPEPVPATAVDPVIDTPASDATRQQPAEETTIDGHVPLAEPVQETEDPVPALDQVSILGVTQEEPTEARQPEEVQTPALDQVSNPCAIFAESTEALLPEVTLAPAAGRDLSPVTEPAESSGALQAAEKLRLVTGHDFSRAASAAKSTRASAPEVRSPDVLPPNEPFSAASLAPEVRFSGNSLPPSAASPDPSDAALADEPASVPERVSAPEPIPPEEAESIARIAEQLGEPALQAEAPILESTPHEKSDEKPAGEPEPVAEAASLPAPLSALDLDTIALASEMQAEPLTAPEAVPSIEPGTDVQPAAETVPASIIEPPAEPATAAEPTPVPEPAPELEPAPIVPLAEPPAAPEAASVPPIAPVAAPQAAPIPEPASPPLPAARQPIKLQSRDDNADLSPFSVVVDQVYDGPLDLLLDLIRKQDIDIYDIPIAMITAQFLAYVNQLKASDVDVAGEFIYIASLLIHIKSKMLLPRAPSGPEDAVEDPRHELVERLLEHERFKNAAQMLQQKQMLEAATWTNPGLREFRDDTSAEPELAADTVDLVRIFRDILERARTRPVIDVSEDAVTVGQMIHFLARRLTMEDKPVALRRLLSHTRSERALIAMFLALLELVRLQAILLRQDRQFSEIFIKKHTGFDAVMNEGLANARDDWR